MTRRPKPAAAMECLEVRQLLAAAASGTEVLAQFTGKGVAVVTAYLKANPKSDLAKYVVLKSSKQLFSSGSTTLSQFALAKGANAAGAVKLLKVVPGAKWASPNYVYGKAKGEATTPTDPQWVSQSAAIAAVQLPLAWDVTLGSPTVTVAVLDDGVDGTHQDLQGVMWTNADEIAGNGIDDDANGYIDDVRGYDFGKNDADPSPALDPAFNVIESHGTQVAGVIGAAINNGFGITGVAPGVKIMPVRFRGADVNITSAGLASSVAYAANNGAKIINLSFSFEAYMNDPAFTAAVDLAYDKNVLWVNSSGNSTSANPPRTLINKIIFVNNVNASDVKYADSNWGLATDLSAPGTGIRAPSPVNNYYPVTGTSYASAVASGVAALIWSKNPTWTRDQVAAQLLGTTDSIDALNSAYAGQLGTGRVNAFKAVTNTLAAPTVRGLIGLADGATVATAPSTLSLNTFSVLDRATVTASAFELRGAGADAAFGTDDDTTVPLTITSSYFYASNRIDFSTGQTLPAGKYRFTAKTTIGNPFGTKMASAYVSNFTVAPAPPAAVTGFAVAASPAANTNSLLSWSDTFTDETNYVVDRSKSATFATIDRTFNPVANTTQYEDWGLSLGTTYYYRIRAVNGLGAGANSATVTFTTVAAPAGLPAAPTSLSATLSTTSQTDVQLRWADTSNNETGFTLQRSTSPTFATIDKTFTDRADSTQYIDWGLTPGATYYYRIRADNAAGTSAWSSVVTYVAPSPTVTVPAAPSSLSAAAESSVVSDVMLRWTDNSNNETTFTVQRSTSATFATLDKTFAPRSDSVWYTDWGLTAGVTYYYRIRAENTAGASAWSGVVTYVAPLPPSGAPSAPSALTAALATTGATDVQLRWTDGSNNETGFTIQRSTSATFATISREFTDRAGSVQYIDWGLTPGVTYYFRIRADNPTGVSAWSNVATYVTP